MLIKFKTRLKFIFRVEFISYSMTSEIILNLKTSIAFYSLNIENITRSCAHETKNNSAYMKQSNDKLRLSIIIFSRFNFFVTFIFLGTTCINLVLRTVYCRSSNKIIPLKYSGSKKGIEKR